MEPVVQVTLEGDLPSYTTDDFEICESKAQNRAFRPWLKATTQQVELLVIFSDNNNQKPIF